MLSVPHARWILPIYFQGNITNQNPALSPILFSEKIFSQTLIHIVMKEVN